MKHIIGTILFGVLMATIGVSLEFFIVQETDVYVMTAHQRGGLVLNAISCFVISIPIYQLIKESL